MNEKSIQMLETEAQAAGEAGFTKAADTLIAKATLARKLAIAYEHFEFVPEGAIQKFREKLNQKTARAATPEDAKRLELQKIPNHPTRREGARVLKDELVIVAMADYPGLPPSDVLTKVREAKTLGCFDTFEVAEVSPVATIQKLPDPIVFGRVNGCTDRFFVAEWGTDISINDLIERGNRPDVEKLLK